MELGTNPEHLILQQLLDIQRSKRFPSGKRHVRDMDITFAMRLTLQNALECESNLLVISPWLEPLATSLYYPR